MVQQRILMGGSGSTGSSLLKNILSRHDEILSGEESSLFCKKELYLDWKNYKHKLLKRGGFGLANDGYHIYRGVDLFNDHFSLSPQEAKLQISNSETFQAFSDAIYHKGLQEKGASIWLEKTPSNAFSFSRFLANFESSKVIHIYRNPLDAIASLVARGFSVYYSVSLYLMNTSAGLAMENDLRCHSIKYESLVNEPQSVLSKLCDFIGISYDDYLIQPDMLSRKKSQLPGWNLDENGPIAGKSVGRFATASSTEQLEILQAISVISINNVGVENYHLSYKSVTEIAQHLGYELPDHHISKDIFKWKKERLKDIQYRLIKFYPTGRKYPIQINIK